mmetsp:Transcript_13358/g.38464  ORF Transcript_13358/g.38464 Transcript_13358/m.38464 type:complete len:206 (+) Transcript_13358:2280-2897(+)
MHDVRDQRFVLLGAVRGHPVQQAHGAGQHSQMLVLKQLGDLGREFLAQHQLGIGAHQPQQAQRRLLFHPRRRRACQERALDIRMQGLQQLQTGYVRNGAQCQGLGRVRNRDVALGACRTWRCQIFANRVDDRIHHGIISPKQQAQGGVTNILLRVLCRSHQRQHFRMPKVDIVSQNVNVHQLPDVLLAVIGVQGLVASILSELLS